MNYHSIYHFALFVMFYTQAIVMICLTPAGTVPITQSYSRYAENGGSIEQRFTKLFDINIVDLVYFFLTVSALQHLLLCMEHYFLPQKITLHMNEYGLNWIRWADYSITAPTMMIVIGLMNSILNFFTLLSLFGCIMMTIGLGILSELVIHYTAWLELSSIASNRCSSQHDKGSLKELYIIVFVLFLCFFLMNISVIYVTLSEIVLCTIGMLLFALFYMYCIFTLTVSRIGKNDVIRFFIKPEHASYVSNSIFGFACLPCVYAWTIIFVRFFISAQKSEGEPPEFVYAINFVLFILFLVSVFDEDINPF
eukprot:gene24394-29653_t